jgi:transcriptional regulator with XRE-family HTH domain
VAIGTEFVKKIPNPIDRHVGSRVRMRRVMLGMSQEKLGDALGLTFQQVQKYEKGTNRIGASRLQQISRTLDVPPAFFFEGAPSFEAMTNPEPGRIGFSQDSNAAYVADFVSTPEGLHLNLAFARIHDPKVRKRIVDLVSSLAGDDDKPEQGAGEAPDSGEVSAE